MRSGTAHQIRRYLLTKAPVIIVYNNEAGDWQWSVCVEGTNFWLNSFETLEEAERYCNKHGLNVLRKSNVS